MSLHLTYILLSFAKCSILDYCSVFIMFRSTIAVFYYKLRFLFSPGKLKSILSLIFHAKLDYVMVSNVK